MIAGAIAISLSVAADRERASWRDAMQRECDRYGLNLVDLEAAQAGDDPMSKKTKPRSAWDILILLAAVGTFVGLATQAERPAITMNLFWAGALLLPSIVLLGVCGGMLWKRTNFS
jgi:NhaP-type Na+/H+ or K+/H+ antiporter